MTASEDDNQTALADELGALHSIYPGAIRLLESSGRVRLEISLPAWEGSLTGAVGDDEEPPALRVLVTLRDGYPGTLAPQLQLLGLYLGSYPIDAGLCELPWQAMRERRELTRPVGDVTRTYITSAGVPFTPGDVCVFDGLVYVQGLAGTWYAERLASGAAGEAARVADRNASPPPPSAQHPAAGDDGAHAQRAAAALAALALDTRPLPLITSSEPITDRKSAFVGHAARITDERDVAAVVQHLLQDRKIARAAHPTIYAYRIVRDVGGVAGKVVEAGEWP